MGEAAANKARDLVAQLVTTEGASDLDALAFLRIGRASFLEAVDLLKATRTQEREDRIARLLLLSDRLFERAIETLLVLSPDAPPDRPLNIH